MSEAMERTCANCVNHEYDGAFFCCKLGVNPISGRSLYSQQVRNFLLTTNALYHSKVTKPCGLEGLYWEDGRQPNHLLNDINGQYDNGHNDVNAVYEQNRFQREHENQKRTAHLTEEIKRRERLAAEVLNGPLETSIALMENADDGVSLTVAELRHADDLLVKALGDSFAEDKWSKPFKMAE